MDMLGYEVQYVPIIFQKRSVFLFLMPQEAPNICNFLTPVGFSEKLKRMSCLLAPYLWTLPPQMLVFALIIICFCLDHPRIIYLVLPSTEFWIIAEFWIILNNVLGDVSFLVLAPFWLPLEMKIKIIVQCDRWTVSSMQESCDLVSVNRLYIHWMYIHWM